MTTSATPPGRTSSGAPSTTLGSTAEPFFVSHKPCEQEGILNAAQGATIGLYFRSMPGSERRTVPGMRAAQKVGRGLICPLAITPIEANEVVQIREVVLLYSYRVTKTGLHDEVPVDEHN